MKTILFILSFCSLTLFGQTAVACTCIKLDPTETDPAKLRESARHYYLDEFHGALFTGKVLQSDEIWYLKDAVNVREVIVEVEKFWLGVDKSTVTIYTEPGDGSDCGVNFEVGKEYF